MTDRKIESVSDLHFALQDLQRLTAGRTYHTDWDHAESADNMYDFLAEILEEIIADLNGTREPFNPKLAPWNLLRMSSNRIREFRCLKDPQVTRAAYGVADRLLAVLAAYNFDGEGHAPAEHEFRYNLDMLFGREVTAFRENVLEQYPPDVQRAAVDPAVMDHAWEMLKMHFQICVNVTGSYSRVNGLLDPEDGAFYLPVFLRERVIAAIDDMVEYAATGGVRRYVTPEEVVDFLGRTPTFAEAVMFPGVQGDPAVIYQAFAVHAGAKVTSRSAPPRRARRKTRRCSGSPDARKGTDR